MADETANLGGNMLAAGAAALLTSRGLLSASFHGTRDEREVHTVQVDLLIEGGAAPDDASPLSASKLAHAANYYAASVRS